MGPTLKKSGVSFIAVLALGLVLTSISAAANFTAASYPAVWEGKANPSEFGEITTEAGTVVCTSASASAVLSEASSTIWVTGPSPTGCKAFGFVSATVNTNGCSSLIHLKEELGGGKFTATADLACPEGKSVVTTAGTCEVQVHPQNGNVTGELTNQTGGTVKVDLKNQSVKSTVTKDGIGCPFSGTGEKTNTVVDQLKAGIVKIEGNKIDIG